MNRIVNRGALGLIKGSAIVAAAALLAVPAHAAAGGGTVNIEGLLQSIIDLLTGNIARLIAVLAVIFLGYRAFTGGLDTRLAVSIGVAIFLVFGGAWVVDQVLV